jgi:hypothetical protein
MIILSAPNVVMLKRVQKAISVPIVLATTQQASCRVIRAANSSATTVEYLERVPN